jgi:tetratricopeptide (TPR) repeat protein
VEPQSTKAIEVFYSYAHEDETWRDELKKHLANLRRQGIITDWYDRDISGGKQWDDEIKSHLDTASVILLLISPDFMNSDYCNDVEVARAMERHKAGEARVIPVILRPVDWKGAPFSKLQALPTDARPTKSWDDPDEAFLDITKGIRKAIEELSGPSSRVPTIPDIPRPPKVGFVSRRDRDGRNVVERLQEELAPRKNQLVALWGAGGVGKTTITAEAVRSLTETTGQRVIWTSADSRANFSFSTMLDDIAEQLGRTDLRPLAPQPKGEELRVLIATSPTLIVLDNFETIPPEEALLCIEFLTQRALCPTLITTRERIDKASLIPLAGMSSEEANEFLERLITQTHDPDIYAEVDRDHLLRTAEFNPLIIQWIVAQIDLAEDPEEVLGDLAQGEGDAAQRVFDRSFNLPKMADGGRAILLALSLFMPSATRPALAEVAGMNLKKDKDKRRFKRAQRTLASLWLIKQADGGQRLSVEGLTREMTRAHLFHDTRAETFCQRFVNRFLGYAQTHQKVTPSDLNALENEKDNLLNAIDVAADLKVWGSVIRLGFALQDFLKLRGYWDEAIQRSEQALDAAKTVGEKWYVGALANNLGGILLNRGDYHSAEKYYKLAVDIAKGIDAKQGLAATLHALGMLARNQGEVEEARRLYNESLEIEKRLGDQSGIASSLHSLAILSQGQGEIEEARRLYNESLEIGKRLGDQSGIANTLHQLAMLTYDQGEVEEARRLYNESLEIGKRLGDQSGIANTLHQLAMLTYDQGEVEEARRLYNESLEIGKRLGDQNSIARSLHQLAMLTYDQGEVEEARRLYNESLEIKKRLGDQSGIASSFHQLGTLAQEEGDLEQARQLYDRSLEITKRLGDQSGIASALHQLGMLAEMENNRAEAARLFCEALGILERLKSPKAEIARRSLERVEKEAS